MSAQTSSAQARADRPAQPPHVLAIIVGGFFGLRAALTMVLVRLFSMPPQLGAAVTLVTGLCLVSVALIDLMRPHNADHSGSGPSTPLLQWVALYLAFTGGSLIWGGAYSLLASLGYWTGTAIDVGLVLLLLRRSEVPQVSASIMRGFIFGVCVVAIIVWLMPAQYDLRLGDEDYLNANTIANLCAFGFFFSHTLRRTWGGPWRTVSFFLAITLVRSLSKSGIAAFAVSATYLLIQDRLLSRKTKFALTCFALIVVLAFWGLFEAYYDVYTTAGNQAQTLTGRTAIWIYVINSLPEHPWIGHGFDSMWKTVPSFGTFQARHAENELLQQLYAYGLAGAVMLVGVYGSFFGSIRKSGNHPVSVVLASMLLFTLVRGLAEAEPFDLLMPLWAIVLLGSVAHWADQSRLFRCGTASGVGVTSPSPYTVGVTAS